MGVTFAAFSESGNIPDWKHEFLIKAKGSAINLQAHFTIETWISSDPELFLFFKEEIKSITSYWLVGVKYNELLNTFNTFQNC